MAARIDKINEEVRDALSSLLRQVKDPRISSGLVSITRADVTPDLKLANIYFSVLGGDTAAVQKGLKSASGWLRRELARTVLLRNTPELTFVADDSIQRGTHILELLRGVEIPPEEPEPEDTEN